MVGQKQERKTVRQKMLELLSDGYLHTVEELQKCLYDDQAPTTAVPYHISLLRGELSEQGHGVVAHREDGTTYYQLVRLVKRY